jgi:hypothetical protein
MKDSWCSPLFVDGHWIYGGAARNKRISVRQGMDRICREVGEAAAKMALERATQAAEPANDAKVVPLRRIRRTRAA